MLFTVIKYDDKGTVVGSAAFATRELAERAADKHGGCKVFATRVLDATSAGSSADEAVATITVVGMLGYVVSFIASMFDIASEG